MAKKAKKKPTTRTVRVICAWCKKVTGKQKVARGGGDTHGICPACMAQYFPEEYTQLPPQKKRNPETSYDDVLQIRDEALEQARVFVSEYEEYENSMSGWTRDQILDSAREASRKMLNGKAAIGQTLFSQAENFYLEAKEELEDLVEKIKGQYGRGY